MLILKNRLKNKNTYYIICLMILVLLSSCAGVQQVKQPYKEPPLAPEKGTLENPYNNYNEAANAMIERLARIVKTMMPHDNPLRFIIGKTDRTSSDIALAFSQAVSSCGLEQVIEPENWLPVIIREGDRFELGLYQGKHRQQFETANMVVAVDSKDIGSGKMLLNVQLLALRSVNIIKDGENKVLAAGTVLPYCISTGYAKTGSTISAVGIGICNRDRDPALWEYTAKEAANIDAKQKLAAKVQELISGKQKGSDQTVKDSEFESQVRAYLRMARMVWERFDKDECKAEAMWEIEIENVKPVLSEQ